MPCPVPLPVESSTSPGGEGKQRSQVPGYTGYVPRKKVDNIFGGTFAAANASAAKKARGEYSPTATEQQTIVAAGVRPKAGDATETAGSYLPRHPKARYFAVGGKWRDRLGCTIDPEKEVASRLDGLLVRPPASPRDRIRESPSPSRSPTPSQRSRQGSKPTPQTLLTDRGNISPSPSCQKIPGYSGFIPGVESENVFGVGFKGAEEKAVLDRETARSDGASSPAPSSPSSRRDWAQIPGYTGHMPGLKPKNFYGATHQKVIDSATQLKDAPSTWDIDDGTKSTSSLLARRLWDNGADVVTSERTAGRNLGTNSAVNDGVAVGRSPGASSRDSRCSRSPKASTREGGLLSAQRAKYLSCEVPPGYLGHVPKVDSGNVYGKSFRPANSEAIRDTVTARSVEEAWAGSLRDGAITPQRSRSLEVSPGREVPGYTGYVPGKASQNVFGTGFREANETAAVKSANGDAKENQKSSLWGRRGREARKFKDSFRDAGVVPDESSRSDRSGGSYGSRSPSPIDPSWKRPAGFSPPGVKNFYVDPQPPNSGKSEPSKPRSKSPVPKNAMPHYGGYVPKKDAQGMYGIRAATIAERSKDALDKEKAFFGEDTGSSRLMKTALSESSPVRTQSPARAIPGYSGYIPKVQAENVFGSSFKELCKRVTSGVDPVSGAETETKRMIGKEP